MIEIMKFVLILGLILLPAQTTRADLELRQQDITVMNDGTTNVEKTEETMEEDSSTDDSFMGAYEGCLRQ